MKHKTLAAILASAMVLSAAAAPVSTAAAEDSDPVWIISDVEAQPGEDVMVTVSVEGDTNGINSYILEMDVEGELEAVSVEAGPAYEGLSMVSNLEAFTFAGTNYSIDENIKPSEDGAVVFSVIFHIPEAAEPGLYNLTFQDLIVYDMDMNQITVAHTTGSIKVLGVGGQPGGEDGKLGDVNEDGDVDATDAAKILVAAAAVGAGGDSGFTETQAKNADVNGDGTFNSQDAANVLQYAAAAGSGFEGSLEDFIMTLE